MFVALGMWAGKGHKLAFFIGMGLYALDASIYIFAQDWINVAFHGYFLYILYGGLKATGVLKEAIAEVDAKVAAAALK